MNLLRMMTPFMRVNAPSLRSTSPKLNAVFNARRYCTEPQELIYEVETYEDLTEKIFRPSSEVAVLVDCYADWCGPCKNLTPKLEEKIRSRGGTVLLAKVNVDIAPELALDLEVNAVPTVIAVRGGYAIGKFVGDQPDGKIDEFIDKVINGEEYVHV